jgi:hypothetical protein
VNTPSGWQKSSFSSEGSSCLELAIAESRGPLYFRESDDPSIVLTATRARLRSLLDIARSQTTVL